MDICRASRCGRAALVVLALGLSVMLTPASGKADAGYAASLNVIETTATQSLSGYMRSNPSPGLRYYAHGVWHATDGPRCWYCYDAAGVGAAVLGEINGDANLRQVSIDTFNAAISRHQLSNGAFANDNGGADAIATGFFSVDLGVADLELQANLNTQTRARWSAAVQRAADYLINSGNMTWYINGNVNLRQTEVMWLAWAITGQQRFLTAYDQEWVFATAPPQSRWPGYGLKVKRQPIRSDGVDGRAYLAESDAGGTPGYDPSYTDAQLDTVTDLYVLTRDPRYLRLMNMMFDQLRPRIDKTWTLNAEGGSRKSYRTAFMNPAVSVLAASGERPDLASGFASQVHRIQQEYKQAMSFTNVNFYKGFENWLGMPLINDQWPNGMAPDTRVVGAIPSGLPQPTVAVTPGATTGGTLPGGTVAVAISNAPLGATASVSLVAQNPISKSSSKQGRKAPTVGSAVQARIVRGLTVIRLRPSNRTVSAVVRRNGHIAVKVVVRYGSSIRQITIQLRNNTRKRTRHR